MWKLSVFLVITVSTLTYSITLSSLMNSLGQIDFSKFLGNVSKTLNGSEMITQQGYPVEEHTCNSDGYNLQLFRIPGKGPTVLIVHGLFSSSDDFMAIGENSLPYKLHRKGCDVWVGNVRGNVYSRKHDTLNPDDASFWDFSWHEIGVYDLPAMIDYILEKTGEKQLVYIGHSQGTTSVYVLLSEIPEYNDKIVAVISLASVSYSSNVPSPVVQLMAENQHEFKGALMDQGIFELLPRRDPITSIMGMCGSSSSLSALCLTVTNTLFGFNYDLIDYEYAPTQFAHFPSGCSALQLYHYLQIVKGNNFQKYDYGSEGNLKKYGSEEATSYAIEKITAKMAIIYSENDWLSNFVDVQKLISRLPNVDEIYKVPFPKFNHADFLWAKNADVLVYDKVIELIDKYTGIN